MSIAAAKSTIKRGIEIAMDAANTRYAESAPALTHARRRVSNIGCDEDSRYGAGL